MDVTGIELNREEMIKFDMHVVNKASPDWKDTLLDSHKKLEELKVKAREYEAQTGNHIRPICLIQVERTGAAQRGQGKIHSEDVREHLIKVIGVQPEEVAVKTSEKDELKEVDDIGGLMSRDCRIRYIITKQALQEGWDCAFAYVLAILTNPGSKTALTQLVGRILRQPFARKTGIKELDESYVYCFQQKRPGASGGNTGRASGAKGWATLSDVWRLRMKRPGCAGRTRLRGPGEVPSGGGAGHSSGVRDAGCGQLAKGVL